MTNSFPVSGGFVYKQNRRVAQTGIEPTAVQKQAIGDNLILNTTISTHEFNIDNGDTALITTTADSSLGSIVGDLGLSTVYFETSTSTIANLIPYGSSVLSSDYTIVGPTLLPNTFTATDGKNLVWYTHFTNNTGSTQTVVAVTQLRYLTGMGGDVV